MAIGGRPLAAEFVSAWFELRVRSEEAGSRLGVDPAGLLEQSGRGGGGHSGG